MKKELRILIGPFSFGDQSWTRQPNHLSITLSTSYGMTSWTLTKIWMTSAGTQVSYFLSLIKKPFPLFIFQKYSLTMYLSYFIEELMFSTFFCWSVHVLFANYVVDQCIFFPFSPTTFLSHRKWLNIKSVHY